MRVLVSDAAASFAFATCSVALYPPETTVTILTDFRAGTVNFAFEKLLPFVEHSGVAPRIRVAMATFELKGWGGIPTLPLISRVDHRRPFAVPACVVDEFAWDQSLIATSTGAPCSVHRSVIKKLPASAVHDRIFTVA